MTDGVVTYLREAASSQTQASFAETLASLLKEPKVYMMKTLVATVPYDIIFDLIGRTIDI